jgi:hypothetical protein
MPTSRLGLVPLLLVSLLTPRESSPGPSLLRYVHVGSARIVFASDTFVDAGRRTSLTQSTFESLRLALGDAQRTDTGDAGSAFSFVCYHLSGTPRMSLVLGSDEMGARTWITEFTFAPTGTRPDLERQCRSTSIDAGRVYTDRGLRLGLTRRQVDHILNLRGRDSADVVLYYRDATRSNVDSSGKRIEYTESAGFTVHFRRGHVAGFGGWRSDVT